MMTVRRSASRRCRFGFDFGDAPLIWISTRHHKLAVGRMEVIGFEQLEWAGGAEQDHDCGIAMK